MRAQPHLDSQLSRQGIGNLPTCMRQRAPVISYCIWQLARIPPNRGLSVRLDCRRPGFSHALNHVRELALRLIEALRTLRVIHYSAWIARRWHDSAFLTTFPWFGSVRYWQDRILELREAAEALMQKPPLGLYV